jgi:5-formyltetrahydrofolate cyclo-ligase
MRGLRSTLPAAACAERSARIAVRLLALEPIAGARSVALFWPIEKRHEVDLRALDARLRERNVRIAYPAVDPQTHALTFRFVASPGAMKETAFQGVSLVEPSADEPEATPGQLDVIVLPALAVDPTGQRIGYGAGHYDRALPRFAPPATSVAVAFDFQLVAELPATDGDVRTDYVVTDARSLRAS